MKITTLLLAAAFCGATAFADEPNPDQSAHIRAQKERIHKILQAAESLQAAGMEREANQLREEAGRQMEEIEAKVRREREPDGHGQPPREGGDRDEPKREQPPREGGDRDEPKRGQPPREGGDRAEPGHERPDRPQSDRERGQPEIPGGPGRALPPPERPRGDVGQLQAQLAELRATVRMLAERLERLEGAVRNAHPDAPPPGDKKPE